ASGGGGGAVFGAVDPPDAGAAAADTAPLSARADIVWCVTPPPPQHLRSGQAVVGLLQPLLNPRLMADLAERGVTAISLDGLPRTLSRAQRMDAMSSQGNIAGYKGAVAAANAFERFFPLLITAAGTSKPAAVLVLGAGVAGLQAIGTARRLGAVVRAYDVRPAARDEVKSLGAQVVELKSVEGAAGEGGYARALTAEEQAARQAQRAEQMPEHVVVNAT